MTSRHRASIEIIHRVLSVAAISDTGVGTTELMYGTYLSSQALKKYIILLANNDFIEIRPPNRIQRREHPLVRRWFVCSIKGKVFLKLYSQSRSEDLIWWEQSSKPEELRSKTQLFKSSDGLRIASC